MERYLERLNADQTCRKAAAKALGIGYALKRMLELFSDEVEVFLKKGLLFWCPS